MNATSTATLGNLKAVEMDQLNTPSVDDVAEYVHKLGSKPAHLRLGAYLYENTDSFAEAATFVAIECIMRNLDSRYIDIKKNMQNEANVEKYFKEYLALCNDSTGRFEYRKLPQERLDTKDIRRLVYDRELDLVRGLICTSVIDNVQFIVKGIAIEEYALQFEAVCAEEFDPTTRVLHTINAFDQSGNFVKQQHVVELSDMRMAHDEFYPYHQQSIMDLIRDFYASKSNVLVLLGEPGTGKSTLSKHIISQMAVSANVSILDNASIFEHPAFAGAMAADKETNTYILEDSDILLGKRSAGNAFMSSLLNAVDGIVPSKTKYIFTTNLTSLASLDPAIMRPGRLFAAVMFKSLTVEQAHAARAAAGLPARESFKNTHGEAIGEDGTVTLSEALSQPRIDLADGAMPKHTSMKNAFGFAPVAVK